MQITKENLQKIIEDKLSDSVQIVNDTSRFTLTYVRPDALAKFLVENDIIKIDHPV